jgi:hypothetical protein
VVVKAVDVVVVTVAISDVEGLKMAKQIMIK